MKKWKIMASILVLCIGLFPITGLANETKLINTEFIESEPINVVTYLDAQLDYIGDIVQRLLKSGKPSLISTPKGIEFGLEVTAIENILIDKVDLIAGYTFQNDNPSEFFWGIEYNLNIAGGIGELFSRFKPALYVMNGKFCWGFSFELRPE